MGLWRHPPWAGSQLSLNMGLLRPAPVDTGLSRSLWPPGLRLTVDLLCWRRIFAITFPSTCLYDVLSVFVSDTELLNESFSFLYTVVTDTSEYTYTRGWQSMALGLLELRTCVCIQRPHCLCVTVAASAFRWRSEAKCLKSKTNYHFAFYPKVCYSHLTFLLLTCLLTSFFSSSSGRIPHSFPTTDLKGT